MSKKTPSRQLVAEVIAELIDLGCVYDSKVKTFHTLRSPDRSKCLYIGKTRVLRRIDISGFIPAACDAVIQVTKEQAKELRIGAVRGQIFPDKAPEGSNPYEALLEVAVQMLDATTSGFKTARKTMDPYAQDVADAEAEANQEL